MTLLLRRSIRCYFPCPSFFSGFLASCCTHILGKELSNDDKLGVVHTIGSESIWSIDSVFLGLVITSSGRRSCFGLR